MKEKMFPLTRPTHTGDSGHFGFRVWKSERLGIDHVSTT